MSQPEQSPHYNTDLPVVQGSPSLFKLMIGNVGLSTAASALAMGMKVQSRR